MDPKNKNIFGYRKLRTSKILTCKLKKDTKQVDFLVTPVALPENKEMRKSQNSNEFCFFSDPQLQKQPCRVWKNEKPKIIKNRVVPRETKNFDRLECLKLHWYTDRKLASHAGVFRGARISSLPVGRDEKRAPLKTPAWEANRKHDGFELFFVIFELLSAKKQTNKQTNNT